MIRAEVVRAVVADVAHDLDAREHVALRGALTFGLGIDEPQHEVLLVVAQLDVELRLMLLDQVVLEEQRLLRRADDDRLDLGDGPSEKSCCDEEALVAAFAKILTDARAKVLRLADVDHLALGVFEEIDAGIGRNPIEHVLGDHEATLPRARRPVRTRRNRAA